MALQIWLPLIKDINNYGLYNCTPTDNGVTQVTTGKLGSCYEFNPASSSSGTKAINLNTKATNFLQSGQSFSCACWFKLTGSLYSNGCGLISCAVYKTSGFGLMVMRNSGAPKINVQMCFDNGEQEWQPNLSAMGAASFSNDIWYHVCYTFNQSTGKMSLYINGALIASTNVAGTWVASSSTDIRVGVGTQGGWGYTLPGQMNDARIYDHCLSPKEVKETAQGLVVHYKLDDTHFIPTENLIQNFDTSFESMDDGPTTIFTNQLNGGTIEVVSNIQGHSKCLHVHSNGGSNRCYKYYSVTPGTYVISAYCYNATSPTAGSIRIELSGGGYNWTAFTNNIIIENDGVWERKYVLVDITANTTLYIFLMCSNGEDVYWDNIQMELNSYPTEYTKTSRTGNTIYDCSGYRNDGTIMSSIQVDSNSPRYDASTLNTELYPLNVVLDFPQSSGVTFASWVKLSAWGYQTSGLWATSSNNPSAAADYNATTCNHYDGWFRMRGTNSTSYSLGPCNNTNISLNTWYHIAVTHDGVNAKLYINGILSQTLSVPTSLVGFKTLFLGYSGFGGTGSSGRTCKGNWSDFRMYATALSAADIKELYDTAASIDNGGNLHDFECVEDEVDKAQVLKTGIVKTNNFIEISDKLKVLGDGSVFLQILHHNNPASNLFTVNNCWLNNTTDLYSALLLLKDSSWFTSLSEYEFLICEKLTSTSTESQYRWKQTNNPSLTSTVTGYSVISGSPARSCGLKTTGSYAAMHNGATWYVACGSYSAWNNGIPGVAGAVTSGYLELYVRIPDEMIKGALSDFLKMYKKSILGKQMIER